MIRFGPSGNSQNFYDAGFKSTIEAPKWLRSIGLNAYEYSFGRGYIMSLETAEKIGQEAKKYDIALSIHAPYYINFANVDNLMAEKSFSYITRGFDYLKAMQANRMVLHLATQGSLSRKDALLLTESRLDDCLKRLYDRSLQDLYLCPETMGKFSQIGLYEEIIDLCSKDKILIPTLDFGHINCTLRGALKSTDDYKRIFDYAFNKLGEFKTKNCHIHFSKIRFGEKGELNHLNYEDKNFGPDFEPLARVIYEYNLTPTIICESSTKMAEDALTFKNIYDSVKNMDKF